MQRKATLLDTELARAPHTAKRTYHAIRLQKWFHWLHSPVSDEIDVESSACY